MFTIGLRQPLLLEHLLHVYKPSGWLVQRLIVKRTAIDCDEARVVSWAGH